MTVYENYDVIAFKSCIQIFTVQIFNRNLKDRDGYTECLFLDFVTRQYIMN